MPDLTTNHAEADTAIFTVYTVLRSQGYTSPVVLDTEYTDDYVQAAYVAKKTPGLLCVKRKHQLINAQSPCSAEMAASIIALHVITGCDSAFYGTSKKVITDRVEKSPDAQNLLAACGRDIPLSLIHI